ncbi:MAG: cysteine desulfurase family protein [Candidatus Pacebacteria bacterium]|nr:cysteine desulfurase family protein [Candidatus Paceibacterota bacterium]
MKRIYLDHAASTPVDPRVERVMRPYFLKQFGNPGSLHSFGQEAIAAVDAARETSARLIGADFHEIVFTGSATEANNLAIRGAVKRWKEIAGNKDVRPRIIVSAIEHESVLETVHDLERDGAEIVRIPVNNEGLVDATAVSHALAECDDSRTVLISVMYANNEIGSIQPVAAIGEAVRVARNPGRYPLFHTDAVQAFQFLDCDVRKLGVDMMTLSAHKIYGPKGIGALYVRNDDAARKKSNAGSPATIMPIVTGGGQEFGMRSGTESVPLIVGFAKAAELAAATRKAETKRLAALRQYLIKGIKKISRKAEVNGPRAGGSAALPNILNVRFPGHTAEDLIVRLDLAGIAVSAGSACRARATMPSYVIRALGHAEERANESIRMSFGRGTTKSEISRVLKTLEGSLKLF